MLFKIFSVPLFADESLMEEVNHFVKSHKIIDIKKELGIQDGNSVWTFCFSYLPMEGFHDREDNRNSKQVDLKLSPEQEQRFQVLKKIRLDVANAEGVSAFMVFTNMELAEICRLPQPSPENILSAKGIKKSKAEKYASIFKDVDYSKLQLDEKDRQPDTADSVSGQSLPGF